MCTSKMKDAQIAQVLYTELCQLEQLTSVPPPRRRQYTSADLLQASIVEVWDIALYLGVSRHLRALVEHGTH